MQYTDITYKEIRLAGQKNDETIGSIIIYGMVPKHLENHLKHIGYLGIRFMRPACLLHLADTDGLEMGY